MGEAEGEEGLLAEIREAEERVRIRIEKAEGERETLLRRAREEALALRKGSEAPLRMLLDRIREEGEREIRSQVEAILRDEEIRIREITRRGSDRLEAAGRFILDRVLGESPEGSNDCPDDQGSDRGAPAGPGAGDGDPA